LLRLIRHNKYLPKGRQIGSIVPDFNTWKDTSLAKKLI
jgi:hypothetical protein